MKHRTQQTQPSASALFLRTEYLGTCCYLFKININPGKYKQFSKTVGSLLILISQVSVFFSFNQGTGTNCGRVTALASKMCLCLLPDLWALL